MISCQLLGGLGNQLFQIFTTIAYCLKYNYSPIFLNSDSTKGITFRKTYWDTFLYKLKNMEMLKNEIPEMNILKEPYFAFCELPKIINNQNYMLFGYFQSYKYFEEKKEELFKMIELENQTNLIKNEIKLDYENIISMHFRIGDYKYIQGNHPIMPIRYYENALKYLLKTNSQKSLKVLYFCEKDDLNDVNEIINILKNKFENIEFICINLFLIDWMQMLIMSCCKYNIIANSSFSWWGAYFNMNPDKIVCYPNKWFGAKLPHDTSDLFPEEWIQISAD